MPSPPLRHDYTDTRAPSANEVGSVEWNLNAVRTDAAYDGAIAAQATANAAVNAAALPSNALTVYVTKSGSDSNNGLAVGNAKLTIAGALSALAGAGGLVQLGAGTYVETNFTPATGTTI